MNPILPKLFRTVFAVLTFLTALCAVGLIVTMLVDPTLPEGARFGPYQADWLGQPATLVLEPAANGQGEHALSATAFNGAVTMNVDDASGVIEELKGYGLPVMLMLVVFSAALFELLRRLFRNVGRGESFTPQTVRLVQIVGGALIFYSFVSGVGESWFAQGMWSYLAEHMQIAVSGTPVELPPAVDLPPFGRFPFRSPPFYCGLLVLALAEVFRQGLVLKRDSDLTV